MKICSTCKVEKSLIDFTKDKQNKDGLSWQCKLCKKQWRIDNVELIKKYNNKYSKQYRLNNGDKVNKYGKEWRIENKDKINQYAKGYGQTPEGKLVRKSCEHKRRALKKANTPIGKNWKPDDIKLKFKLQHGKCVYCETSISDYYEIDHFVPVSKNGSNEPSNIQLLCKECNGNGGKGRKDAHEFAQQHGKLF